MMNESTADRPEEEGPTGKPSQAEGSDGPSTEDHTPLPTGRPSQAEGDDDAGQL